MSDTRTIEIPESVLISAHALDDLGDWLSTHDPQFMDRMRHIRDDDVIDAEYDVKE